MTPPARRPDSAACRPLALEGFTVVRRALPSIALFLTLAAHPAAAQEWAEKMFNKLEHDFQTVARGADTVYKFEVKNIYKQDMHITGVRSSCGCTSVSVEHGDLKTHEKGYIVARFNTHSPPHLGANGATLTVTFGAPYFAEVQLRVKGVIRGDVVFNPGAIEFGDVAAGQTKAQEVAVDYAGRGDWKIIDVTNDNDNFEVELNEAQRAGGRITYKLLVRLKPGVPVGYVKDQLTVVTNDKRAGNQRLPLIVNGRVRPEFSVTPEKLVLGELEAGKQLTKRIVVRGVEPFKIVNVTCGEEQCFDFKTDSDSRTMHFVEVTFRAGENPGKLQTPIRIETDRGENRGATCIASATVIAPKTPPAVEPAPAAAATAAPNTGIRTAAIQQ
jgi:hypothetical protein